MRILGLDHVVIRTVDAERMIDFYCRVLGCQVDKRIDALGLIHLRAGRSMIDLVTLDGPLGRTGGAPPGAGARNMDHLCLRIEPFDEPALRERLLGHGIDMGDVKQNYGAEGNGPSVYLTDPEGNVVELKGPPI